MAALEYLRRCQIAIARRRERSMLAELAATPARLRPEFQKSSHDLLNHFRVRTAPSFVPGFEKTRTTTELQRRLFPAETERLIESARMITEHHRWSLLGFNEMDFGEEINWNRDPLSGRIWPLAFHADLALWHNDGSDIRVLWELNRLGHFITLGRAYALTQDELFADEFFAQLSTWREQNPVARGANWWCAMEVALRATNLLAAFTLFRASPKLSSERLAMLLAVLDQHGGHIRRNLEFSHVLTSNHYLSDIVGLLWLGIMLPELRSANEWREWAITELLREMDKQILADGADYEASTGYHRFVLELFLYSFILCKVNHIEIPRPYWEKLRAMLAYERGILRPDGFAPLIGDTDGGQVLPIVGRSADDHAYLLALGAVIFEDSILRLPTASVPEELLWILGEEGVRSFQKLTPAKHEWRSQAFLDSGTYVQRSGDCFLLFSASGAGANGRGGHGHNDALAIEVSACGRPFIVDPGIHVYTADLHERHLFRSTAYHSTIQIDDLEQNTISESTPFVIGNEARPRLLCWQTTNERDYAMAEHIGYERYAPMLRHQRSVTFNKAERWWLVEDQMKGNGEHSVTARFHFDSGLDVQASGANFAVARDNVSNARLFICPIDSVPAPEFELQFSSRQYGSKRPSVSAVWRLKMILPCILRWAIVPVCGSDDELERLKLVRK